MWSILRQFSSTSWLFSLLLVVSCLILCWPLSKLISILSQLKKLSLQNEKNIRTNDLKTASETLRTPLEQAVSLSSAGITKISAVLLVLVGTVFVLSMFTVYRRAQCTATGVYWESKNFTIDKPGQWDRSWDYINDDGSKGTIVLCPTSNLPLKSGLHFDYAKYEYRDGCIDFSAPEAKFSMK